MSYRRYAEYKDSGVEWLGEVPEHWAVRKLKFAALALPSNVDKKSHEGEIPVYLCNYTDVYYNEEITQDLSFMKATASQAQIRKFTLKRGDTIITKDSEDPNDIAIPTYVPHDMEGVVCGYHLTLLRAENGLVGAYLKRLLDSHYARSVFATRANGLTRYGLSTYAIKNFVLPLPSIAEQKQIAAFLDKETAKIDALIEKQQRLIELLEEKRQAVISHAVTKGLNSDVKMKDSGVEWLGEVPEHWSINRAKVFFQERNLRSESGEEELLTVSHLTGVSPRSEKNVNMFLAETLVDYKICKEGDLVINTMWAWMGAMGSAQMDGIVSPSYNVYEIRDKNMVHPVFIDYLVRTPEFISVATSRSKGVWSSRLRLYPEAFFNIGLAVPPLEEQRAITEKLFDQLSKYEAIEGKCRKNVELLQERRTALISAAVTGKIDVRSEESKACLV